MSRAFSNKHLFYVCVGFATFFSLIIILNENFNYFPSTSKKTQSFLYKGTNFAKSYVDREFTLKEIFIHKAIYDQRDPIGPRIRLLVTATCYGIKENISMYVSGKKIQIEWIIKMKGASCRKVKACQYGHYDIGSKVYRGKVPSKIVVYHNSMSAEISLDRSPTHYTESISACIKPMHWYNDWVRLIVFIEWTRRQGIDKFLIAVQSVSKTVWQVLNYYQKRGIVEIHYWPLLPFSEWYDPNPDIYWVSEMISVQYCAFWSQSKYTYQGDFDDFIYIRNRSISYYDYLEKWRKEKKDFGGISFQHVGLKFRPEIVDKPFNYEQFLRFDGFKNAQTFQYDRLPKSIFLTKFVKESWIHRPRSYFADKKTYMAPEEEALYLHWRYDFDFDNITDKNKLYADVQFFSQEEKKGGLDELRDKVSEIFKNQTPVHLAFEVEEAMKACQKKAEERGCVDGGASCFDEIFPLDDWVLAEPTEESHYTLIP